MSARSLVQKTVGAIRGTILDVVSKTTTAAFSTGATSYTDWTDLLVTVTPKAVSSKVLVVAQVSGSMGAAGPGMTFAIYRDSTKLFEVGLGSISAGYPLVIPMQYLDSPGTTSPITYKVRMYVSSNTFTAAGGHTITAMEIAG